MIALKFSPYLLIGCVLATVIFLFSLRSYGAADSTWRSLSQPSSSGPLGGNYNSASAGRQKIDTTSEIGRASNATLGFQKIMVLGLPERSDKRDAFVLSASLTGFEVEFMDAVKGDDIPSKALPPGMNLQGAVLGSWRSHLDAIRSIIENNLASAFIMEDDVDWDIRLLSQMPEFAKGIRSLSNIAVSKRQHSPYGDDWDILWPGHCGDVLPTNDDRIYTIENDETVAPTAHQPWLMALKTMPEHTRIIHKAGAPICSFGYAVSYRGAQKLIAALGVKGTGSLAIDNGLAFLCRDGYLNMQCYTVEPQLFNHHRPAGSVAKDSDINSGGSTSTDVREKGVTEAIVLSARLNYEQVLMGSTDYITQW